MAQVLLERETVEGDAVTALLDNEWDAYLEREEDIKAAKEERNARAAGRPAPRRPRQSDEEIAADAAAFAEAAVAAELEHEAEEARDQSERAVGDAADDDAADDAEKTDRA